MKKKQVHIYIDHEIYNYLRGNFINISALGNKLLREYIEDITGLPLPKVKKLK